ncbi:phosphohistidine phosphatase SixA [Marinimicrobium sp. C6131]|uniref:phosphohistidine phosphatase SixA n=1 Tax=Marinimicrobium sp. C6131 TaxID=3022676 RepID=UPI00223C8C0B|nr:phosphohistidine phosphatase SixA [Marinimicrobium sp. C6131]UZJ45649.1 phosphohistidine phosphatase SixA [Marinimicrobium sp. C6131]
MKTLFIMRHGQAQAKASSDAERPLTARGAADVERVTNALSAELSELDQLWVSPYRRARQTAAIVNQVLGRGAEPVVTELLTPDADLEALCAQLQVCEEEHVLLVSHMPLVGDLIHYLTGAEPGRYPMGTASVACLTMDVVAAGVGELRWLRHRDD